MRWIILLGLVAACGSDGGCPPYMTIKGGTFAKTSTALTWTLEVESLPATLTFDQANVPANFLEYEWGVELDSDGNGAPDFKVSASHARRDGAPETVTADILGATQQDLWREQSGASVQIGDATASLAGTTFTFSVLLSEDAGLAAITDARQSTWVTYHVSGPGAGDQCSDSWQP